MKLQALLTMPFIKTGQFFSSIAATIMQHAIIAKEAYIADKATPIPPKRNAAERAFLPAALEILESPPNPVGRWIIWSIIIFFIIIIIWASLGKIDIVTVTTGKVVPSGQVKIIQSAQKGVVRSILVEEGQRVSIGDILIQLDPTDRDADLATLRREKMDLMIEVVRLQTMIKHTNTPAPSNSPTFVTDFIPPPGAAPEIVLTQLQFMRSLFAEHYANIARINQEIRQLKAALHRVESEATTLENILPMIKERATAIRKLTEKGYESRAKLLELEQKLTESHGQLKAKRHALQETQAQLDARLRERDQIIAEFKRQRYSELALAKRKLNEAEQSLIKAEHSLAQQTLRSPATGIVQELQIHTIGGVVEPAQELMKLVPANLSLEVEAMIENRDIGFVHKKQTAEIKIETFNFTKYGVIKGRVAHISEDAINDKEKGLVYEARIDLDKESLHIDGQEVRLTSGMAVTAEIKTGRRRIIEFLLAPILRAGSEAMRER